MPPSLLDPSFQYTTGQQHSLAHSSIQSLPDELLCEVFQVHLFASNNLDLQNLCQLGVTLRLACRRWNAILLGSPLCWSRIHLRMKCPPPTSALALWLERSKDVRLSITIRPLWGNSTFMVEYIDLLAGAIDRWQVFEIEAPCPGLSANFFKRYVFKDAVQLQRVSLHLLPVEPITESVVPIMDNVSALRHLRLAWDFHPHSFLTGVPPVAERPWNNLQTLSLHATSVHAIWSILHNTPQIASLWIEILPFSLLTLDLPPPGTAPVSLPFLHYLSLLVLNHNYRVLEFLDTPLLSELCINRTFYDDGRRLRDDDDDEDSEEEEIADPLPSFLSSHLSEARHSLTTLTLVAVTDFDIATFVQHPIVKDLHTMQIMNWGSRGCNVLKRCVQSARGQLDDCCKERKYGNYSVFGWEDESKCSVFRMTRGSAESEFASHTDQWRKYAS